MAVLDGPDEWFWKIAEVWKRRKLTCGLKSIGKRAKRKFPERSRELQCKAFCQQDHDRSSSKGMLTKLIETKTLGL
jgi:hypothetical protein